MQRKGWRTATRRSKVNAGTASGPTLCLNIVKGGSPTDTDTFFRTNSQALTSLPPLSLEGAFQPATLLEAEIAPGEFALRLSESATTIQVAPKLMHWENGPADILGCETTISQ